MRQPNNTYTKEIQMPLSPDQRKFLDAKVQVFASRVLATNLLKAVRDVVLADQSPMKPGIEPTDREFFKEGTRFTKQEDSAEFVNKLDQGRKDLEHAMKWLASYYKQLKPTIDGFTKKLLQSDPGGLTKAKLNRLSGIMAAVLRLVETLETAGASVDDLNELVDSISKELTLKPSTDQQKSGLRKFFGK